MTNRIIRDPVHGSLPYQTSVLLPASLHPLGSGWLLYVTNKVLQDFCYCCRGNDESEKVESPVIEEITELLLAFYALFLDLFDQALSDEFLDLTLATWIHINLLMANRIEGLVHFLLSDGQINYAVDFS